LSDKTGTMPPKPRRKVEDDAPDQRVGRALRGVYQETVEETVPDEMLDLLKKLG